MPYHSLGEAHRRLSAHLGGDRPIAKSSYPGLLPLVATMARSTMVRGG
jgi:hypothetical protein